MQDQGREAKLGNRLKQECLQLYIRRRELEKWFHKVLCDFDRFEKTQVLDRVAVDLGSPRSVSESASTLWEELTQAQFFVKLVAIWSNLLIIWYLACKEQLDEEIHILLFAG